MCGVAISFWLCYASVPTTTEVIQHEHGTGRTSRHYHGTNNAVHRMAGFYRNRTTIPEDKIMTNELLVADTPESIDMFRMIALCGALKLELLGMKSRGPSAYAIIKREYGLRGNKQSVFDQFKAIKDQAKQERQQ